MRNNWGSRTRREIRSYATGLSIPLWGNVSWNIGSFGISHSNATVTVGCSATRSTDGALGGYAVIGSGFTYVGPSQLTKTRNTSTAPVGWSAGAWSENGIATGGLWLGCQ